jgi:hypothetical protein
MKHRFALGVSLAIALTCSAFAADDLKSGPQVGSRKIPPFNPLHCNTKSAGTKACLV